MSDGKKATGPGVGAPEPVLDSPARIPAESHGAGDRDRTGPELGKKRADREEVAAGPELTEATFSDPEPGECPVCWDDDRVRSTLVNVREGGQSFIACLRCESEFYDTRCQLGGEHFDSMLAADCDRLTKEEERLGITKHLCHAQAGKALKEAGVKLPTAGSSQPERERYFSQPDRCASLGGDPRDPVRCVLPKGHDGDHQTPCGKWTNHKAGSSWLPHPSSEEAYRALHDRLGRKPSYQEFLEEKIRRGTVGLIGRVEGGTSPAGSPQGRPECPRCGAPMLEAGGAWRCTGEHARELAEPGTPGELSALELELHQRAQMADALIANQKQLIDALERLLERERRETARLRGELHGVAEQRDPPKGGAS